MKQKTHSGLKKRVKVRKSGTISVQKSCKNHLLDNKSKKQKKSFKSGMPVASGRMQSLRRLMPGKVGAVKVKKVETKVEVKVETKVKTKSEAK